MSERRSHTAIWLCVTFVLIALFTLAPLISAFIASGIADALGCTVNEGGATTCMFRGSDIGQTLAELFVLGWLFFATLPIGLVAFAIWLIAAVAVAIAAWRRRRRVA